MKVAITNNTGLQNRGCEALVVSLIEGLREQFPQVGEIEVHTNDPLYDRWRLSGLAYARPSYLTLTPNHSKFIHINRVVYALLGAGEKLLPPQLAGYPVRQISALQTADLVLPTGGDIFTSDYNNLRKHLSTITCLKSKKAALIGHTIGPFSKNDERYFRRSLRNVFAITARESESFEYLTSLNLDVPVHLTADLAFGLDPIGAEEASEMLRHRYGVDSTKTSLVALSVSEGVIRYSKLKRDRYLKEFEEFIGRLNKEGHTILLVPHVMERNPNNNDLVTCEELHSRLANPSQTRVLSGMFTAKQFKGIIGLTKCLIGARTHATIASISQAVPTVSVAYSRKAYGIMADVFGKELGGSLTIPADALCADRMSDCFRLATSSPEMTGVAVRMKQLAKRNFQILAEEWR